MTISILDLSRFPVRSGAARAELDAMIARADLVAVVAYRKHELERTRLERDDAMTDAQLRLAMAQAALEEFDARPSVS